ncbi:IPT/TIG domain-containing protein [Geobacter sp. AOG2]|uniref:IPT/TIG domain-containing protein n=1 Tax=Geobacter sp. AOG2 TaxID=1566347 RepID=UPI001CC42180|nr:IPT/TIG domain-containing protein [Geobacter sp. AOG2]GFE60439.1 transcription factor [Geobacter sp. AOG2]
MKNVAAALIIVMFCLAGNAYLFAAERPQRVMKPAVASPDTAPSILSIIPALAEPGDKVTIFGSNFGEQISAFLGSVEIPAKVSDGRQLEFIVPSLDAGLYALYLKRGDGVVGRVYNFSVLPQRPVLNALSPDRISSCAQGGERDVTASGRNFSETSLLFFDNTSIKSRVVSPEAIVFRVPQVTGGLHQVLVKNSPENASVPLALEIETKPEISQVGRGDEYVNYYELIIDGKNFQQNSALYVDGQRIGGNSGQDAAAREKVIFIDCTRLVYQRFPYSPVAKEFRLQVVNPGNEGSQVVNVSAP